MAQSSSSVIHLEEGHTAASSSLVEGPVVANKADGPLALNNGSSEEGSWYDEIDDPDRDWKKRREEFYNVGYLDGKTEGEKDAAQEGFNHGFKDSVMVGYKWGIVRGITSALAHIPAELKVKLALKDEIRTEFLNLHDEVANIGTEDALKFFYDDIQRVKSAEQSRSVETDSSLTHQSGSVDLEDYSRKLELLLKESPALNVHLELNENPGT